MVWGGNDGAVDNWVKQLENNDPKLESLHILSFRRVSTKDLERIFKAIAYNTVLTELYISGHALDASSADQLSESLTLNETLKTLNLGNATFGKDPQIFGLFCEGLAANESLTKLDLENKGLLSNDDEKYSTVKLLAGSLAKNKHLEELNLARNDLDNTAIEFLAPAFANLLNVNVSMNKIGPEGAEILSRQMSASQDYKLQELNLSDNPLLNGATIFVAALAHNKHLRVLKMVDVVSDAQEEMSLPPPAVEEGGGKLDEAKKEDDPARTVHGNALAIALGQALATNKTLTHVWLDNNSIESNALQLLACYLAQSAVQELKLRQNRIDDEGAVLLAQATSGYLRFLELGENIVKAKGFGVLLDTNLEYLGLFGNAVNGFGETPDVLPALKESSIEQLDIGCNQIVHQDLEAMVEILLNDGVPKLKVLEMGGNVLDNEMDVWEATIEKLLARRDLEVVWKRQPTQMENAPPPVL
ncbi:hypothetical protein G6F56_009067 [Rhizopus delemar]|uniref:T-complex-associated testis-expressed protein 1 n=1 Tax=Rhizopus stolonifer TaxID=4846 RepID=A0A367JWC3_RHIST|nr:hypothetical protein G6F56_009067 [Rhizopus delemar]RCH94236.1 T-complex-associated testis-expressed protein 1 [Rhizopus stolonifer]